MNRINNNAHDSALEKVVEPLIVPSSSLFEATPIPFISRWSLHNGFGSGDTENGIIPESVGQQDVKFQSAGAGCGIFQANVSLNEQVYITGQVSSDSAYAILRLPLSGQVHVKMPGADDILEDTSRYGLFLHSNIDSKCTIVHQPGADCRVIAPMISESFFRDALRGMRLPLLLDDFMNGCDRNTAVSPLMSPRLRRICFDIARNPYAGDLSRVYLSGKILEIIANTISDLSGDVERRGSPEGNEHRKIAAICELLLSNLDCTPRQEDMARFVGMTQRRLAAIFRDVTGKSIAEWVLEKKLDVAAEHLCGGELSVKEVAYRSGYAYVSTFTAAFTRRFGVPPASYRRSVLSVSAISQHRL